MTSFQNRLNRDMNEIADQAVVSESAWNEIERRIAESGGLETDATVVHLRDPTKGQRGTRWGLTAVAAAVLLVATLAVAVRPNSQPTIADDRDILDPEVDPLGLVMDYVEAFNEGDADAAVAVFNHNARISDDPDSKLMTVDEWQTFLTYHVYQRSQITDVVCSYSGDEFRSAQCKWTLNDAVTTALTKRGHTVESEWILLNGRIETLDRRTEYTSGIETSALKEWIGSNPALIEPELTENPNFTALLDYNYHPRHDLRNLGEEHLRQLGQALHRNAPGFAHQVTAGATVNRQPDRPIAGGGRNAPTMR